MQIDPLISALRGGVEPAVPASKSAPTPVPAAAPPQPTEGSLRQAVAYINDVLRAHKQSVQFEIDQDSGKTVVRVIDEDTKEILRQFPSEEVLAIARAIPPISGALIRDTA